MANDEDKVEWIRGQVIGTGRFGCVYSGIDVRRWVEKNRVAHT